MSRSAPALVAWKIWPALPAGKTMVLKAPPYAPPATLKLGEPSAWPTAQPTPAG